MKSEIRPALLEDAALIAALNYSVQKVHQDLNPKRYKKTTPDEETVIEDFRRKLEGTTERIFIASVADQPVGYVSCQLLVPKDNPYVIPEPRIHIDQIGVEPDYRGQGIGSALIDCVMQLANDHDIKQISIGVFAANTPALRLYERLGFHVESVRMVKEIP